MRHNIEIVDGLVSVMHTLVDLVCSRDGRLANSKTMQCKSNVTNNIEVEGNKKTGWLVG